MYNIFIYLIYAMKKSLLFLAWITAISVAFSGIANAQLKLNINELFSDWNPKVSDAHKKLLNDYDGTRWYTDSATIECDTSNGIVITSPLVSDSLMENASIYNLFISPYRIKDIKEWSSTVDTSKIKMKKVEINDGATDIKFNIPTSELEADTAYYWFIIPADIYDEVWTPSTEICFQVANNICLQDTACDTLSLVINPEPEVQEVTPTEVVNTGDQHGAANCVWMDLANVSHTISKDNVVTLTWTAVDWDNVQIAIFDPNEEIYKSIWTAKMKDEKFTYKMQWNWVQLFMLTNGCKEITYKVDAAMQEATPEKIVTPATWPAENILYIAIAAIILYGAYAIFFRKSDD